MTWTEGAWLQPVFEEFLGPSTGRHMALAVDWPQPWCFANTGVPTPILAIVWEKKVFRQCFCGKAPFNFFKLSFLPSIYLWLAANP